ncbi:YqgE/AlgH family protein [Cellulomonas fimi]|uniref:YqgE/AlgH family protein n=1 Tax=Cellulomonas fimi TaxID=1708 RepID=UPI00059F7879|nr:YqgE/AlgH family protein [Cellulomonas fimi]NNH06508.1 YqgE/AlgH family protein [Cellulomonas fimi]
MTDSSLSGRLLVAKNRLLDPNFHRTVVLLLDHGHEGAFGVVLNRPVDVDVDVVLPAWQEAVCVPSTLFQGGPVGLDGAIGVVTAPPGARLPGTVDRLVGPFGLVDLDSDPAELDGLVTGVRVFAGHAGWGPGQLEAEVEEGSWYVLDAESTDAVTPEPELLWRRVLRRQGGDLAIVSTFAEDASLN